MIYYYCYQILLFCNKSYFIKYYSFVHRREPMLKTIVYNKTEYCFINQYNMIFIIKWHHHHQMSCYVLMMKYIQLEIQTIKSSVPSIKQVSSFE